MDAAITFTVRAHHALMRQDMVTTAYKQLTCEGCLAVCLLHMAQLPTSIDAEIKIMSTGFSLFRSSYAVAICLGFALTYNKQVSVTVESPVFAARLQKDIQGVRGSDMVGIKQGAINTNTIQKGELPCVVYVDSHAFSGTYEHSPHFVCMVDRPDKDTVAVLDPATGETTSYPVKSLMASIRSLRSVVRFSPILIRLGSGEG